MALYTIGQTAKKTGLTIKMIRYYEEIGLLQSKRTLAGYRMFGDTQVNILFFIANCKKAGLDFDHIQKLVQLLNNPHRKSLEVSQLIEHNIKSLEQKSKELEHNIKLLRELKSLCQADHQANCEILSKLGQH